MRYVAKFRSPIAFLIGAGSVFLMQALGTPIEEPARDTTHSATIAGLLIVLAVYPLAGLAGCLLFPRHPLRAARRLTLGVFAGITLHIILFPDFGGYERNLFPFEIAIHTVWAAVCCFLVAAFWRVK